MIWTLSYDKQLQKVPIRIIRLPTGPDNIIGTFQKANYGYWLHYWKNLDNIAKMLYCTMTFFTHENE